MKKIACLILICWFSVTAWSQTYQPNWESLDSRPVPQWFKDAKFGIFIHWGVYSVPGWCTKGNYAEWYQQGLQSSDTARQQFHAKKFGTRTYYDLANDFKAELFNPDEWAKLFEQSGAKYIVLTSKHHDGFTLWPSKEANKTWGFPWNAVDIGPKRDLLGDLFKAVRKTSVHAGMYYSLYEWFNPLWKKDKKKFAAEHTWPQMKELINTYQPDVFWTDGDWEAPPETWKSQEFLAWLYNESPVKNKVIVNDRWGEGVRFAHGGIYTPEYQPGLDFADHYWEESRGMGFSYGYNREEDAWDYNSTQSLVLQLIDKVSRGGNFLLDIGPDEHGKIPPIMQERLLQMGEWLKINGDAIYNTSKWKQASQWSEGRTDYKPAGSSGDLLLKLTIDPEPGYAVKELFFSYNEQQNNLYAIFPKYPDNKKIVLRNIQLPVATEIDFLSTGEKLNWTLQGKDTWVTLPDYSPNKIKTPYAYVLRIKGYGGFAANPRIEAKYPEQGLQPTISINVPGVEAVRYTTDGTEPTLQSNLYSKPFVLSASATIKATAFQAGVLPSNTSTEQVQVSVWKSAISVKQPVPGIAYRYYQPSGPINMTTSFSAPLVGTGIATQIDLSKKQQPDKFAFQFYGYISIAKDAVYDFYTQSDDGSQLLIDDEMVVNNDGDHGKVEKAGRTALKKGFHRIWVRYYDSGGGNELNVLYKFPGSPKTGIPASLLFH